MLSNVASYKPLEIQSDCSISSERRKEKQELVEQTGFHRVLYPDSYENASWYLGAYITSSDFTYPSNPLSFKNTLEQSLASKATSQMQDFLASPNLAILQKKQQSNPINKNTESKNIFGGYSVDEYGFMGEDFNKAVGLPSDSKIHKNALQALNDYFTTPIARGKDNYLPEFESIDLIAGISYANQELRTLPTENKEYYTKEEIMQMTKGSNGAFYEGDFNTPLMQDYRNEKGEFKKEGVLLMYAFKSDSFAKAQSPYTQLSEYGKFQRGMPSSYNPNGLVKSTKEKTPEEKAKEIKDALMEYYMKALEESRKESEDSVSNSIAKEINKKSINQLEESLMDKETKN